MQYPPPSFFVYRVVKALLSAIKNATIDSKTGELTESEHLQVVERLKKQASQAQAEYLAAAEEERAAKEQRDIDFLLSYLPKQVTADELDLLAAAKVQELGVADMKGMGKVIGQLKQELGASAPGGMISEAVKKAINAL